MSESEWQVARRRKGQARKCKSQVSLTSVHEQLDVEKVVKRIRTTVTELRCEEFWPKWKDELLMATSASAPAEKDVTEEHLQGRDDPPQCVCYGLGSFSSCAAARYQLAMLLLLLEVLQVSLKNCFVYDPIFSSGEQKVLRELGMTVLTENEEGKRPVTKPTLFYLMHCGKALYNNLLWKNWSVQGLSQLRIIGNSFNGMRERTMERVFKQEYSYISKAVELCEEKTLPCSSRMIDVFSDTAVITFPRHILLRAPQINWAESHEPEYKDCQDLEIILKTNQS
ncbi:SRR1-like protein [Oryzias melastigma]|uniref:SRR1 domain containing n=1 Tax=Oryzias melastigma TaxID=30732 RepID=A0A3B3D2L1_ORYME|nr:SRR1-like protein [Oryzias melastigma]